MSDYDRIRLLWPDHLGLARGKYLPVNLAEQRTGLGHLDFRGQPYTVLARHTLQQAIAAWAALGYTPKVVMWYASANRDEAVFDEPFRFDVGRTDNEHFAFGGGGPNLCLGAFLARLEVSVLLEEMAKRSLCLEQTSEPVRARSNFVHGVLSVGMQPSTAP